MAKDTERIVIELNDKLKEKFKDKLSSQGRTMKWQVVKWIKNFVNDKNGKQVNN